ncbi:beta-ketoacyl-ACP synthase II [Patescibacteria group bacterium]|nr:beta-ketoacyl-ACP synthase II [Patescibacteria group bacterium]
MRKRIVITGIGVVSSIGIGKEAFWESLKSGKSGISSITRFDTSKLSVKIAGEVKDFDPYRFMDKKLIRRTDRFSQYGIAASKMAVEDASIDLSREDRERVTVFMGAAIAGGEFAEEQHTIIVKQGPRKVSPLLSIIFYNDSCVAQICIELGLKGGSVTLAGACAASSTAIAYAFNRIREDHADVILAGGVETPIIISFVATMSKLGAMSRRNNQPEKASRPFDRKRDGFVVGEGSCVLVLEELNHALRREAPIYAEIAGVGTSTDAYHITSPEPTAEQASRTIRLALIDAELSPDEIDYINAHGSSTQANDVAETRAIKKIFGAHAYNLAISSTKSEYGHPMGAAGAMDLAATCLAIEQNLIPPTINYEFPDPECDLDYTPNKARIARINNALSNSFGFGGHNACIAIKRFK